MNSLERQAAYVLPSEGCNCLFQAQTEQDLEILEFMKRKEKRVNLNFEDLWCGKSIGHLYEFFTEGQGQTMDHKTII